MKNLYKYILYLAALSILSSSTWGIDFRFIVAADCRGSFNGVNTTVVHQILSQITTLSPAPVFFVIPGDMINGGSNSFGTLTSQLRTFKDAVTPTYYPATFFYPGVGNHETNSASTTCAIDSAFNTVFSEFTAAEFYPGFGKTAYYFDYGNSRFFMLNSNHAGSSYVIDSSQREWMAGKLTGKTHYFVFLHAPAYPTGAHVGSSLDVNTTERDAFWQLLDDNNVSMVFVGHEHNYTRRHVDSANKSSFNHSIYQVTTGSFGAPLTTTYTSTLNVDIPPIAANHFAVVDVTETLVQVNVYKDDWSIIDSFSIDQGIAVGLSKFSTE